MAHWAVIISPERYEAELLFHHDTLELPPGADLATGDEVLVLAGERNPEVVALGAVRGGEGGALITYTRRSFDAPHPAGAVPLDGPVTRLDPATFRDLADQLAPAGDRRSWLVSVDLPIEAGSPAEAVRQFWSYVMQLGPRELPAFVSPSGDELAMQAYVLGATANLDPQEDDD